MTRDNVKKVADALGRLEALEAALADADRAPHSALPISFVSVGPEGRYQGDECGTKAYYPREQYVRAVRMLMLDEERALKSLGVEL